MAASRESSELFPIAAVRHFVNEPVFWREIVSGHREPQVDLNNRECLKEIGQQLQGKYGMLQMELSDGRTPFLDALDEVEAGRIASDYAHVPLAGRFFLRVYSLAEPRYFNELNRELFRYGNASPGEVLETYWGDMLQAMHDAMNKLLLGDPPRCPPPVPETRLFRVALIPNEIYNDFYGGHSTLSREIIFKAFTSTSATVRWEFLDDYAQGAEPGKTAVLLELAPDLAASAVSIEGLSALAHEQERILGPFTRAMLTPIFRVDGSGSTSIDGLYRHDGSAYIHEEGRSSIDSNHGLWVLRHDGADVFKGRGGDGGGLPVAAWVSSAAGGQTISVMKESALSSRHPGLRLPHLRVSLVRAIPEAQPVLGLAVDDLLDLAVLLALHEVRGERETSLLLAALLSLERGLALAVHVRQPEVAAKVLKGVLTDIMENPLRAAGFAAPFLLLLCPFGSGHGGMTAAVGAVVRMNDCLPCSATAMIAGFVTGAKTGQHVERMLGNEHHVDVHATSALQREKDKEAQRRQREAAAAGAAAGIERLCKTGYDRLAEELEATPIASIFRSIETAARLNVANSRGRPVPTADPDVGGGVSESELREQEFAAMLPWCRTVAEAALLKRLIAGELQASAAFESPLPALAARESPEHLALELGDAALLPLDAGAFADEASRWVLARIHFLRLMLSRTRVLLPLGRPNTGKSTILREVYDIHVPAGFDAGGRTTRLAIHRHPAYSDSYVHAFVADPPGYADIISVRDIFTHVCVSLLQNKAACRVLRPVLCVRSGRVEEIDRHDQQLNALGSLVLCLVSFADEDFKSKLVSEGTRFKERDPSARDVSRDPAARRAVAEKIKTDNQEYFPPGAEVVYLNLTGWASDSILDEDLAEQPPRICKVEEFKEFFQPQDAHQLRRTLDRWLDLPFDSTKRVRA